MFVDVKEVSFSYSNGISVLDKINFQLIKGETLSIVGVSGSGKSTLLRLLSSILPLEKEQYLNGSIKINDLNTNDYRKSGKLSFMFQEATLMPNLNVFDNIALPLKIKHISDDLKVRNLLKKVGLSEYATFYPKHLSGGMKTRVALARSFATEPELLLLDEPFSSLDISWKSKLYTELENLREQYNTTVIIVTHDIQEALLLSNRIIVLGKDGQILSSFVVENKMTLRDRLQNIGNYLEAVYAAYYIPIQDDLMHSEVKVN